MTYFFAGQGIIYSGELLIRLMFLFIPVMMSIETTLNQSRELVQNGVFELLFINKNVVKADILFSKFVINIILSAITGGISLIFLYSVSSILNKAFFLNIDILFVFTFIIMCLLSTAVGFISSILLKGKHGALIYSVIFVALLLSVFKAFEFFHTYSGLVLLGILSGSCIAAVSVCLMMFKSHYFMTR